MVATVRPSAAAQIRLPLPSGSSATQSKRKAVAAA
jgi:hypothetical protein